MKRINYLAALITLGVFAASLSGGAAFAQEEEEDAPEIRLPSCRAVLAEAEFTSVNHDPEPEAETCCLVMSEREFYRSNEVRAGRLFLVNNESHVRPARCAAEDPVTLIEEVEGEEPEDEGPEVPEL